MITLQFLVFMPASIIDKNVNMLEEELNSQMLRWTFIYWVFLIVQCLISCGFNFFLAHKLTAPINHLRK